MPEQLDPAVAENLASGAMRYLPLTPGNKVICTKRQLQECLVTLAQESFAMGFLSGQKEHFSSLVLSNVTQGPAQCRQTAFYEFRRTPPRKHPAGPSG